MTKTKLFLSALLLLAPWLWGDDLPDWYTPLRDAVYSQDLASKDLIPYYNTAREQAAKELSGAELSVMYSRCEYMMGRALLYEGNKQDAAAYLEKGMNYAQDSLNQKASPEGWQMLAENLSQLCTVRPTTWVMANGGKVGTYAQNALNLDPGNTASQYLIAARWIYAPAPFRNIKKGINMMEAIIVYFDSRLEKDDRFNVLSSIGYALTLQKNNSEAKDWLAKAMKVYPDNKYVGNMLAAL